jgi:hypothetical protein
MKHRTTVSFSCCTGRMEFTHLNIMQSVVCSVVGSNGMYMNK